MEPVRGGASRVRTYKNVLIYSFAHGHGYGYTKGHKELVAAIGEALKSGAIVEYEEVAEGVPRGVSRYNKNDYRVFANLTITENSDGTDHRLAVGTRKRQSKT